MASNSPGRYSKSNYSTDNPGGHITSGLFPDISIAQGTFQMNVGTGFQGDASFIVRDSGYYVSTSDGASTCSSSTAETWDLEGGNLLMLETKSLKSFTTNDEYLFAMKEDLAEWFSSLYQNYDITADSIFQVLETGVLLCKHANKVQEFARQSREMGETLEMKSYFIRSVPDRIVPFREGVKPETFQARDNVSNFISWTRELGIPQVLSFETDDLVLRKNEKSVILCLLEVARVGAKLGMLAPTLIQMEQEIDAELSGEVPQPQVQIKTCDLRSLDERVRDLIGRCTCPIQFPMIKVGDGKYKIGDTRSLIFVRILRSHVMVRVGGGWDTLENYLNKHDPCQCNYRGHRAGSSRVDHKVPTNQPRRSSITNHNLTPSTQTSPKQVASVVETSRNRSASPKTASRTGSPSTLVTPSNIPATPVRSNNTASSTKGSRTIPNQNQQEMSAVSLPNLSSSSSDNVLPTQPIRSNSPGLGHHKSSSTLKAPNKASSPMSSLSTSSKGRDSGQESKQTLRKDSAKSIPRSHYSDDQDDPSSVATVSPSNLEQAFVSDPASSVEENWTANNSSGTVNVMTHEFQHTIGSDLPLFLEQKHGHDLREYQEDMLRHSQTNSAQILHWSLDKDNTHSAHNPLTSDILTKQSDHKCAVDSEADVGGTTQAKILSHFPEDENIKSSSALQTNRSRPQIALQRNSGPAKTSVGSHPKIKSTTSPKTSKLSSGYGQKMSIVSEKPRDNNLAALEQPTTCAISNWLESTNEIDITGQAKISSTTLGGSCSNIPQISIEYNNINKHEESSNKVVPHVKTSGSKIRSRPATTSHIPKPLFTSNSNTLKTTSMHSSKKDTGSSNPSSKANSYSSSVRSLSDIPLSPDSNIDNDECLEFETSHAYKCSNFSNSSNNSCNSCEDISASNKDGTPEAGITISTSKTEMADTHHKLSVGRSFGKLPSPRKINLASNSKRRNSVDTTTSNTRTLAVLKDSASIRRTSSISNIQKQHQTMLTNDITFSDDEEINELIKNSGLKEKAIDKNIRPSNALSRKLVHRKAEKKEVLMIERDKLGHHAVHMTKKNELKNNSTPKSTVVSSTHSHTSSNIYSSPDGAASRSGSKTPDPIMPSKKMSPVGSSVSKNRRISQTKQGKDFGNEILATELTSRPLEEIQTILTETTNSLIQVDPETLHPPHKDLKMFKKMEKLFEKYRDVELKASGNETSGEEFSAESSVKPTATSLS